MTSVSLLQIAYRALGIAIAVGVMEFLAQLGQVSYAKVPFVTSIVLAIALPDAPASTPRAIIGGHIASTLAGIAVVYLLGTQDFSAALAVGLAVLAMAATRTMHPPAGLDAFLVVSQGLPASWLLFPVIPGAILLAVFAVIWKAIGDRLFAPSPDLKAERADSRTANLRRPNSR